MALALALGEFISPVLCISSAVYFITVERGRPLLSRGLQSDVLPVLERCRLANSSALAGGAFIVFACFCRVLELELEL